ncbi:hypothetical protein CC78DRAFT_535309 [Lojkania enalia]|uniref:Uncharacterized protein n=1 Tax=Lojkania enalia TaxID=147567 RepID=A0A9P4N4F3_9PLEO|nr:hypothetical protein CC78DRAFT_535309 [Didymosphaeria enalia]
MSDTAIGTTAPAPTPVFTERELQMLGWAMQSLKSGPPEIDYEKLAGFAGMSNPRSASNAWTKIKNKLMAGGGPGDRGASPNRNGNANGADEPTTPKKTPRKRASKKETIDGEPVTPKKRNRTTKAKKASGDEDSEEKAKTEVSAENAAPKASDDEEQMLDEI